MIMVENYVMGNNTGVSARRELILRKQLSRVREIIEALSDDEKRYIRYQMALKVGDITAVEPDVKIPPIEKDVLTDWYKSLIKQPDINDIFREILG